MKHISNLINLSDMRTQKEHETKESACSETAEVINWLFTELRGSFSAFKQAWPTHEEYRCAKKVWLKAFMLAGINKVEQIQHGLNKCYLLEKPFVPSPGEFIAWCNPSPTDMGLPILEKAYDISIQMNVQFSTFKPDCNKAHSVIRHVIEQIGATQYRSMVSADSFKAFERYYAIACKQFMNGELVEIPRAICDDAPPNHVDKVRNDAARALCMDKLRKIGVKV